MDQWAAEVERKRKVLFAEQDPTQAGKETAAEAEARRQQRTDTLHTIFGGSRKDWSEKLSLKLSEPRVRRASAMPLAFPAMRPLTAPARDDIIGQLPDVRPPGNAVGFMPSPYGGTPERVLYKIVGRKEQKWERVLKRYNVDEDGNPLPETVPESADEDHGTDADADEDNRSKAASDANSSATATSDLMELERLLGDDSGSHYFGLQARQEFFDLFRRIQVESSKVEDFEEGMIGSVALPELESLDELRESRTNMRYQQSVEAAYCTVRMADAVQRQRLLAKSLGRAPDSAISRELAAEAEAKLHEIAESPILSPDSPALSTGRASPQSNAGFGHSRGTTGHRHTPGTPGFSQKRALRRAESDSVRNATSAGAVAGDGHSPPGTTRSAYRSPVRSAGKSPRTARSGALRALQNANQDDGSDHGSHGTARRGVLSARAPSSARSNRGRAPQVSILHLQALAEEGPRTRAITPLGRAAAQSLQRLYSANDSIDESGEESAAYCEAEEDTQSNALQQQHGASMPASRERSASVASGLASPAHVLARAQRLPPRLHIDSGHKQRSATSAPGPMGRKRAFPVRSADQADQLTEDDDARFRQHSISSFADYDRARSAAAGAGQDDEEYDAFEVAAIAAAEETSIASSSANASAGGGPHAQGLFSGCISPRHRFVGKLVAKHAALPLPIIVRDKKSDTLNLAHRSLGDTYVQYLTEVVNDLPSIRHLNLRDNNLTDVGLQGLVQTIQENKLVLKSLDLSQNKLDQDSAKALADYLRSRECTVERLVLSQADLDDHEITEFMDALETNRSIKWLDCSHNCIGGTHEKMILAHSVLGGSAIAYAMDVNSTLTALDLSWNKLGTQSAVAISTALKNSKTLTYFCAAYNAFGDLGAQAIGRALEFNRALKFIDISYNDVSSHAAFVLAESLQQNDVLETIRLEGNPLGEGGTSALLRSLNYCEASRSISLRFCTFEKTQQVELDISSLSGSYELDLEDYYEYALLRMLLKMAAMRPGCRIKKLDFRDRIRGNLQGKQRIELQHSDAAQAFLDDIPAFTPTINSGAAQQSALPGINARKWKEIVKLMTLVDSGSGEAWVPPDRGMCNLEFEQMPHPRHPVEGLNRSGLALLADLLVRHASDRQKLLSLCRDMVMVTAQVEWIVERINGSCTTPLSKREVAELLVSLFPMIYDTENSERLLRKLLPYDAHHEVIVQLGPLAPIVLNSVTGHYRFDLSRPGDRFAALRLMQVQTHEHKILGELSGWNRAGRHHGYTSQAGNQLNIRNELFRGKIREATEITTQYPKSRPAKHFLTSDRNVQYPITMEFFREGLTDFIPGLLEFDYVSTTRPHQGVTNMCDEDLSILMLSRNININWQLWYMMHRDEDGTNDSGGGDGADKSSSAPGKHSTVHRHVLRQRSQQLVERHASNRTLSALNRDDDSDMEDGVSESPAAHKKKKRRSGDHDHDHDHNDDDGNSTDSTSLSSASFCSSDTDEHDIHNPQDDDDIAHFLATAQGEDNGDGSGGGGGGSSAAATRQLHADSGPSAGSRGIAEGGGRGRSRSVATIGSAKSQKSGKSVSSGKASGGGGKSGKKSGRPPSGGKSSKHGVARAKGAHSRERSGSEPPLMRSASLGSAKCQEEPPLTGEELAKQIAEDDRRRERRERRELRRISAYKRKSVLGFSPFAFNPRSVRKSVVHKALGMEDIVDAKGNGDGNREDKETAITTGSAEGATKAADSGTLAGLRISVVLALAKFKSALGHWLKPGQFQDVYELQSHLRRRKVRLAAELTSSELGIIFQDLRYHLAMVLVDESMTRFTHILRIRIVDRSGNVLTHELTKRPYQGDWKDDAGDADGAAGEEETQSEGGGGDGEVAAATDAAAVSADVTVDAAASETGADDAAATNQNGDSVDEANAGMADGKVDPPMLTSGRSGTAASSRVASRSGSPAGPSPRVKSSRTSSPSPNGTPRTSRSRSPPRSGRQSKTAEPKKKQSQQQSLRRASRTAEAPHLQRVASRKRSILGRPTGKPMIQQLDEGVLISEDGADLEHGTATIGLTRESSFLSRRITLKDLHPGALEEKVQTTVAEALAQQGIERKDVVIMDVQMHTSHVDPVHPGMKACQNTCYQFFFDVALTHPFKHYGPSVQTKHKGCGPIRDLEVSMRARVRRDYVCKWLWRSPDRAERVPISNVHWQRKLLDLRAALGNKWISALQAAKLAVNFPEDTFDDVCFREDAVVAMFSRVVDLENFGVVLDTIERSRQKHVCARLGWLNVLNVYQSDRYYDLDLRIGDNHALAEILTKMNLADPGNNFKHPKFRRSFRHDYMPGWTMPANWDAENYKGTSDPGVPHDGQLVLEYTTKAEDGCRADPAIREYFAPSRFLVGVPRPPEPAAPASGAAGRFLSNLSSARNSPRTVAARQRTPAVAKGGSSNAMTALANSALSARGGSLRVLPAPKASSADILDTVTGPDTADRTPGAGTADTTDTTDTTGTGGPTADTIVRRGYGRSSTMNDGEAVEAMYAAREQSQSGVPTTVAEMHA